MSLYGSGAQTVAPPLTGTEIVPIDTGGAVVAQTTTAAIAALAAAGEAQQIKDTAITTVGNGTLTAAGLVGGQIVRTGPTAAYTDTTDTAANIVAALGGFVANATFFVRVKNGTAFPQTLAAGAGVTLPAAVLIGPMETGWYYGTVGGTAAAPTVTLTHMLTTALGMSSTVAVPQATTVSTVGAGSITAAAIAGGIITRSGAQANAAFTDTTDTGTNIAAANPALGARIGASALLIYQNTTNANATIAGGAGVTVSGITVVPAGTTAIYLLTQTAANTFTMVGILLTSPSAVSGTFTANGATAVTVTDSRITANSVVAFGLKTVGGTPAGAPFMSAVTAGTSFQVKAAAGDTSVYNYTIFN